MGDTRQTGDDRARRPRRKGVATALSFLCPGLGLMYVGKLRCGLLANALAVAALAAFVGLFALLEFFPALPLLVLIAGWLVFSALVAADVRAAIDDRSEPYEPKGYNHWTIYGATFLLAYVLPLAATLVVSNQFVWEFETVETNAMYPNLKPGDTAIIHKTAYRSEPPSPGDLVAVDVPGSDETRVLRVVANGAGDAEAADVRRAGDTIYVGGERLSGLPLGTRIASAAGGHRSDFELWVERNGGRPYVVSLRPSLKGEPSFESTSLDDGELYLLADNRSYPGGEEADTATGDSRQFGAVGRERIVGRPLYVAWSTSPSSGASRWHRIGLRLQ